MRCQAGGSRDPLVDFGDRGTGEAVGSIHRRSRLGQRDDYDSKFSPKRSTAVFVGALLTKDL